MADHVGYGPGQDWIIIKMKPLIDSQGLHLLHGLREIFDRGPYLYHYKIPTVRPSSELGSLKWIVAHFLYQIILLPLIEVGFNDLIINNAARRSDQVARLGPTSRLSVGGCLYLILWQIIAAEKIIMSV